VAGLAHATSYYFQVAQRPAWPHHNDSKCSGGVVPCGDGPDRSTIRG
jgi:hypothetical protein